MSSDDEGAFGAFGKDNHASSSSQSLPKHGVDVAFVSQSPTHSSEELLPAADLVDEQKKGWLAYFKTKEFYITLALG